MVFIAFHLFVIGVSLFCLPFVGCNVAFLRSVNGIDIGIVEGFTAEWGAGSTGGPVFLTPDLLLN